MALQVADQKCLVVGGGKVAARKIAGLLACGARVTVVAPEVHQAMAVLAEEGIIAAVEGAPLDVQLRPYRAGEASEYRLVLTATGVGEVDEAVHRDAESAGVWVNSADDRDNSSFVLPAVLRDGHITVTASTSGASPALAVWLRDEIASFLGTGFGELANLLDEARSRVKESEGTTAGVDWGRLIGERLAPLVKEGRIEDARRVLDEQLASFGASPRGTAPLEEDPSPE